MLHFLGIAFLFLGATAYASPKVGDKASFVASLECPHESGQGTPSTNPCYQTGTFSGNAELELVSENFASEDGPRFRFKLTQTYSGHTFTWPEDTIYGGLDNPADWVGYIFENCTKLGRFETITVPAGTYRTCKTNRGNGDVVYWGRVPTGIVRYDQVQAWGSFSLKLLSK